MSENAEIGAFDKKIHTTETITEPFDKSTSKPSLRRILRRGSTSDVSDVRTRVGNYPLLDKIGEGGEGTVHATEKKLTGTQLAVKVGKEGDSLPEADVLKHVRRRWGKNNIVRVIDAGRTPKHRLGERRDVPFVVTELAKEGSLKDFLAKEKVFSVGDATNIAAQIANGLEATHNKGIVHGDVKPGNILITSTKRKVPEVVLSDFGTAGPPRKLNTLNYTIAYAAPEQFESQVDFASDVYSLGTLLYELETGEKFFKFHEDQHELYARLGLNLSQEKYDSFARSRLSVLRETSPESVALLESMLQLDPHSRPDIKTVKQQLSKISKKYSKSSDVVHEDAIPTESFTAVSNEEVGANN